MTEFRDVRDEQRFEQGFTDAEGQLRTVFAELTCTKVTPA